MNIILKNIRHNSFRYLITAVIILFTNIFVLISFSLVKFEENEVTISKNKIGSDLVITAGDTEKVLYNSEVLKEYLDKSAVDDIKSVPGTTVTSRLYLASLNSGCCDNQIQLIATDLDNDFLLNSFIKTKSLDKDEIIMGGNFSADTVKYFGHDLKVVEVLDKTGTSYDNSGFISYELAEEINKEYNLGLDNKVSVIFINADNPAATKKAINNRFNYNVFEVNERYSEYISSVSKMQHFVYVLCIFMLIISLLSIIGITAISTNNRKNEIGSYILIKWPKSKIFKILIMEQSLVYLVTTVISIIITFFLLNNFQNTYHYMIDNVQVAIYSLCLLGINIILSVISTLFSIIKVLKIKPGELIKQAS